METDKKFDRKVDLDINCRVRRVLVRHWIDLGKISARTNRCVVTLSGSLMRLPHINAEIDTTTRRKTFRARSEGSRMYDASRSASTIGTGKPSTTNLRGRCKELELGRLLVDLHGDLFRGCVRALTM